MLKSRQKNSEVVDWMGADQPKDTQSVIQYKQQKREDEHIVMIYASRKEAQEQNKIDFYSDPQDIMGKLPGGDVNIVIGDVNTKVGACNVIYEDVMG